MLRKRDFLDMAHVCCVEVVIPRLDCLQDENIRYVPTFKNCCAFEI